MISRLTTLEDTLMLDFFLLQLPPTSHKEDQLIVAGA
jgi:hypothetical protein